MQLDNFNSRLYYVDQSIIVSDAPDMNCVIAWLRHPHVNLEKVQKVVHRLGFRIGPKPMQKDSEGSQYLMLEAING